MSLPAKITAGAAAVAVAGLVTFAVVACTPAALPTPPAATAAQAAKDAAAPTLSATDDPTTPAAPLTELPEWALASIPWLVYPEGFRCTGTEGCPNDYRATFGEPGEVLPEHVEYYDPAVHYWVSPADQ